MSTREYTCYSCKKKFYISNVVEVGRTNVVAVDCPYCHTNANMPIIASSIPKETMVPVRRIQPLSLFSKYNSPSYPMFSNCLYHITDENNIESIRTNGLLSYDKVKSNNISVVTGGDESSLSIDKSLTLDKFVHLSFTPWCPMFYIHKINGKKLYLIHIDLSVINKSNVLYVNKIATANDAIFYDYLDTNEFDLDAVYGKLDWSSEPGKSRRQTVEKYEILIPDMIEPSYIVNMTPLF